MRRQELPTPYHKKLLRIKDIIDVDGQILALREQCLELKQQNIEECRGIAEPYGKIPGIPGSAESYFELKSQFILKKWNEVSLRLIECIVRIFHNNGVNDTDSIEEFIKSECKEFEQIFDRTGHIMEIILYLDSKPVKDFIDETSQKVKEVLFRLSKAKIRARRFKNMNL